MVVTDLGEARRWLDLDGRESAVLDVPIWFVISPVAADIGSIGSWSFETILLAGKCRFQIWNQI